MAAVGSGIADGPPAARGFVLGRRERSLAWLGIAPFLAFVALFLLWPAGDVLVGAFRGNEGGLTTANVAELFKPQYLDAYETSIELSLLSAALGTVLGGLFAWAVIRHGTPRLIRAAVTAFSGVAANFGGIPLAFAFIATLGTVGVVTRWLRDVGIDLYGNGFSLFGFWGLSIVYLYFQVPLMLLVIAPALDGLRREWREAAESLGAPNWQYWLHVGLPVLAPSFFGAFLLLFGNSFSAYATAYALSGQSLNIVPLVIGEVLNGNVLSDPHLGQALALGMVVVMAVTTVLYVLLTRRVSRWTR
jgi:putative spermidine/putrescine transport system permease protein